MKIIIEGLINPATNLRKEHIEIVATKLFEDDFADARQLTGTMSLIKLHLPENYFQTHAIIYKNNDGENRRVGTVKIFKNDL
jgi:hypothetical protein